MRNPFRFGVRPGTGEVWIGDVGWNTWEEIERLQNPTAAVVNFGWPCYEGAGRQSGYDSANLSICENLYAAGPSAVQAPLYAWNHGAQVVPGETCPTGSSSAAGIAFAPTDGTVPERVPRSAVLRRLLARLHLGDAAGSQRRSGPGTHPHLRRSGRQPRVPADRARRRPVLRRLRRRHDPPGQLHRRQPAADRRRHRHPDDRHRSADRSVRRHWLERPGRGRHAHLRLGPRRRRPVRRLHRAWPRATPTRARASTPPACASPTATARPATRPSRSTSATPPPTATITSPAPGTTWRVGDLIQFAGGATDAQDGPLPASRLSWDLILHHCPSNCHTHPLQSFAGVAGGSFTAPDHEYPSHLELRAHRHRLRRAHRHRVDPARPAHGHVDAEHQPRGLLARAQRHAGRRHRSPGP